MNAPWLPSQLKRAAGSAFIVSSLVASLSASDEPSNKAELIEKGRASYGMFCQACHGPEDPSVDSPSNLFDQKWYHGTGSSDAIEKTIREGIFEKGMPAWGQMISDEEIDSLIHYLTSFQTTEKNSDE